jgi:hypothetical protein
MLMPSASRAAQFFILVMGALALMCRPAAAQASRPQSLHILEIDSDDADEQAEALTGALRSRARAASGWVLLDTTQSLSMLTAALRCPQRPDPTCLQRIGDQLKADRFLWGVLTRQGAGPHQVTAEIHLWARGKPDVVVKETYSDNLKDQGDDTLRKIATRTFDRLTGGPAASVTVHAGTGEGMVIVDSDQKVALQKGSATLLLSTGSHTVEVQAVGFAPASQVLTIGGASQDVNFDLQPVGPPFVPPASSGSPGSGRRILKWGMLIGGGALLVAGGVLTGVFESERSTLNTDRNGNYGQSGSPTIQDPCTPQPQGIVNGATTSGCSAHNTAQAVLVPQIVTLGLGGVLATVGIVLAVTEHKQEASESPPASGVSSLRFVPNIGPHSGSLGLSASF